MDILMQRLRLLCDRAGQGFCQSAGEIIHVPRDEAKRLIDSGQAEDAPLDLTKPHKRGDK